MRRCVHLTLLLAAALALLAVPIASGASPDLVVSQVYAGGGNSGATYANDFVELFNRGSCVRRPVRLVGAVRDRVRHELAGDTARGLAGAGPPLPRRLASGGANGAALPTADATGTLEPRCLRREGRTRARHGCAHLRRDGRKLQRGGGRPRPRRVRIGDRLRRALPRRPSPTRRRPFRASNGCDDTDANGTDFTTDTPAPRNDLDRRPRRAAGTPPPAGSASGTANIALDLQSTLSIALEKPTLSFGNVSPGDSPAALTDRVTVTSTNARRLHAERSPERVRACRPPARALRDGPGNRRSSDRRSPAVPRAALPVAPAADLLVGTTAAPSASVRRRVADEPRVSPRRSRRSRRATTRPPSPSR